MTAPVLFEELQAANGTRIGVATLNVEKTLNALSMEMVHLLSRQLHGWADDHGLALVILQAAGEKAFCAGGDLQNLYRSMREHHASSARDNVSANRYAADFFADEYRLDYLIHTYSKPILCWGHGFVMGGGVGLMAGASHRVVTEQSRVAMPEISIGLYPDVGGSWLLSRMPGKTGLFLALTGSQVRAADALFVGLADYALPHASKATVIETLQQQPWTTQQHDNHALLSQVLRRFSDPTLATPGPLQRHFAAINTMCDDTDVRAVIATITENDIDDAWMHKAATNLSSGSPSSAALAFTLLQRAQSLSLANVFRMEYIVSLHCAARHDFAEGIRALLIEKDGKPQWQPASHSEMTAAMPESYFVEPNWGQHPLADLASRTTLSNPL